MITIFNTEIKKSLKQLRLKLILPDILFFIIGLFLLGVFTRITGLINLSPEILEVELEQFVTSNLGSLISSLVIFVLIAFFIGARLKAFKLNMILEAMKDKEFSLWAAFKGSHKFYWRVIRMKVLSFIILLIGFLLALIVFQLLRNTLNILGIAFAGLLILYIVLALFFKEAALFQNNSNAVNSIKDSFKTFRKNKILLLGLVIIIVLVNFVVSALNNLFAQSPSIISTILSTLFLMLILLVSAWGNLLTFNVYNGISKPVKKTVKKSIKKTVKKTVKKSIKKTVKKSTKKTVKKTRKRTSK